MKTETKNRSMKGVWILPLILMILFGTMEVGGVGYLRGMLFGAVLGVFAAIFVVVNYHYSINDSVWTVFLFPWPFVFAAGIAFGFSSTQCGVGIAISLFLDIAMALFVLPARSRFQDKHRQAKIAGRLLDVKSHQPQTLTTTPPVALVNAKDMFIASDGSVWVVDAGLHGVVRFDCQGHSSWIAGVPNQAGLKDGECLSAQFNTPEAITIDGFGNVFILDDGGSRLRCLATNGHVKTLHLNQNNHSDRLCFSALAGNKEGGCWLVCKGDLFLCAPSGNMQAVAVKGIDKHSLDGRLLKQLGNSLWMSTYEEYDSCAWYRVWRSDRSKPDFPVQLSKALGVGEIQANIEGLQYLHPRGRLYGLLRQSEDFGSHVKYWIELENRSLLNRHKIIHQLMGERYACIPFEFNDLQAITVDDKEEIIYFLESQRLLKAALPPDQYVA